MLLAASDWLRHIARKRRWKPDLALGRRGEDLAHRYLKKRGYRIVARNYRLASGDAEADIIAWQEDTLAFVEVKSRRSEEFGAPERAVGVEKAVHLRRVAREYARKINLPLEHVRFDLVSVVFSSPPKIHLMPNVFSI